MTQAAAVEEMNPAGRSRILLLCDHATNIVPPTVDRRRPRHAAPRTWRATSPRTSARAG